MIKKTAIAHNKNNYKYLSRCQYYGKLEDYEYVSDAMVLKFIVYAASDYFGGSIPIRVYVPTELENEVRDNIIVGESYLVQCVPYRINLNGKYRHRVDLLLNLFEVVT